MKKIIILIIIFFSFINTMALTNSGIIDIADDDVKITVSESYDEDELNLYEDHISFLKEHGYGFNNDYGKSVYTNVFTKILDSSSTNEIIVGKITINEVSDKLFRVEKHFFYNDYYANIAFGDNLDNVDKRFIVNIDGKLLKTNAGEIIGDGEQLLWENNSLSNIEFGFRVINTRNIVSLIIIIFIIIFVIYEIIKRKRRGIMEMVGPDLETKIDNNEELNIIDDQIVEKPIPQINRISPKKIPGTGKKINPKPMPSDGKKVVNKQLISL